MSAPTHAAPILAIGLGAALALGAGRSQEGVASLGMLQADSALGLEVSGTLRRPSAGLSDAQNGYRWVGSTSGGGIAARARGLGFRGAARHPGGAAPLARAARTG